MDDNEFRSSGEPSEDDVKPSGRDTRGRFAPGNPGRLPGTRYKHILAAEKLLDGESEALTRTAIENALAGEPTALRLCLERVIPPRKSRPVKFDLPSLKTAADGPPAIAAIAQAAADGDLTADECEAFLRIIDSFLKAFEIGELEQRVRAIEMATSR